MKISYVMNVLNGEPFLKYQLDSIYKFAHEIIIVEGAYKKFAHATVNGRSKDKTLEVIQSYDDSDNKIKLIVNEGYYEDRMEMCNEFLKYVTGDIIWQVDADEFYLQETHKYVRKLFEENEELDLVSFNFYDYFASTDYYISGYEDMRLNDVNRVHRFNKGDYWKSQRPPTLLTHEGQKKPIRRKIGGYELEKLGHIMHHGTMLFEDQIKDKYKYYNSMLFKVNKPTYWFKNVWESYNNKFNIAGFKYRITYLKKSDLEVPKDLKRMFDDLDSKSDERFSLRDCNDIKKHFESSDYEEYVSLANKINSVATSKENFFNLFLKIITLLLSITYKLDFHTKLFALKVLGLNYVRFFRNKYIRKKT